MLAGIKGRGKGKGDSGQSRGCVRQAAFASCFDGHATLTDGVGDPREQIAVAPPVVLNGERTPLLQAFLVVLVVRVGEHP